MSLHELQTNVHVAKDKRNDFGGYNYRTAEGILAAVKAALPAGASLTISDSLSECAGQIFVRATATVRFEDGSDFSSDGYAMHPITKKGMDPSQITGAASSYARKYALGGLLALDDGSVDPDATTGTPGAREASPERNPDEITRHLIGALSSAKAYDDLKKRIAAKRFAAALAWLKAEHKGHAQTVDEAITSAWRRVDPSMQGADPRRAA